MDVRNGPRSSGSGRVLASRENYFPRVPQKPGNAFSRWTTFSRETTYSPRYSATHTRRLTFTPLITSSTNWIHCCRLASLFLPALFQRPFTIVTLSSRMSAEVSAGSTWQYTPNQCHITTIDDKVIVAITNGKRPKSQPIIRTHYIAGTKNNINTMQTK